MKPKNETKVVEMTKEEPKVELTIKEVDAIVNFVMQLPTAVGKNLLNVTDFLTAKKQAALAPVKAEEKKEPEKTK